MVQPQRCCPALAEEGTESLRFGKMLPAAQAEVIFSRPPFGTTGISAMLTLFFSDASCAFILGWDFEVCMFMHDHTTACTKFCTWKTLEIRQRRCAGGRWSRGKGGREFVWCMPTTMQMTL